MGTRKGFKAKRTPEYFVQTVWRPEDIDGISLKFRDLQVTYSIMTDYSRTFIETIEREHKREGHRLDSNAPLTDNARRFQDLIRIMFSAHLSTYEAILYYTRNCMSDEGRRWLKNLQLTDEALSAFDRLRNRDVHHEPMHTLIGTRYRILGAEPPFSSLDTREIHLHHHLAHEGIGFYPPPVVATRQFCKHPGLVEFVTYESILQLAHRLIHRVGDLLNEAKRLGYLDVVGPFRCASCDS